MAKRKKSLLALRRDALARQTEESPVPLERKRNRKVRRFRNRHHLVPKSRGGSMSKRNLFYIDGDVHRRWHMVFGNRTLEEIIALLIRVQRAKENQV